MSKRIDITVKVNGKEVPLSNISMETIGKIRDVEKEKLAYIGSIFEGDGGKWMLFYDYASHGLNFVCVASQGCFNYGLTYTSNVLKGKAPSTFKDGVFEK